jgi:hypothetical protein
MKTLIIQAYHTYDTPLWIGRCMDSVRRWATLKGYDYQFADGSSFALCGEDYLAKAAGNYRTITNLSRLELLRVAHEAGYDRAVWFDADVFVFDLERFDITLADRYGFARETWVQCNGGSDWAVFAGVNNSVVACMKGEPDLGFLISAIRHVAAHRPVRNNFQVGGELIKGLRNSLEFHALEGAGMFSNYVVRALARNVELPLEAQARYHGAPVYAANLCAADHYGRWSPSIDDAVAAMDRLEATKGEVINHWLTERGGLYAPPYPAMHPFQGPHIDQLTTPLGAATP